MTIECARLGGINMAQGICDTEVPELVRRAAQTAIDEGYNIYSRSDGIEEFRVALARKMQRDNGLDYDPDGEIIATNGATGAFYVAALALLDPGDEVILFEPYYGYHVNTLHSIDAIPVSVPTRAPDWSFAIEDLERAITPRTRGIVLNSPSNPSGKVFTREEQEAIGAVARDKDLFVFTDEVYEHFVFDGRSHTSFGALDGLRDRTITINALSKTFAVTGWRLGWIAADARWTRAMATFNDLVYVCAPTPLQAGCARGLELLDTRFFRGIATQYQAKRDRLCTSLERAGLTPCVPQGAYYVLADVSRLPGRTGLERAMHLLRETGVATVPGEAFFADETGHRLTRFCFGKTDADLDEACSRLEKLG